jgi:hypothetical protein
VQGAGITAVQPQVATDHGLIPYTTVDLTGKGFCPDMSVYFGNPLAETVVDTLKNAQAITDGGTKAELEVARLATTGDVSIKSGGHSAKLANQLVNSFRNVYGFSFPNFNPYLSMTEFEHVFTDATTNIPVNSCPPANCPGHMTLLTVAAHKLFPGIQADFAAGDCFGSSLGAARMAPGGDMKPQQFDLGANITWLILQHYSGTQDSPGVVTDFLNQLQLTQWSSQVTALETQAKAADQSQDGAFLMGQIRSDLDNDPAASGAYNQGALVLMTQYVVSKQFPYFKSVGHAVLAYNIEDDNSGPDHGVIDVYNSNTPFDNNENLDASVHRANLENSKVYIDADGSWSFPELGWSSAAGSIHFLSYSSVMSALNGGLTLFDDVGVSATPGAGTAVASITALGGKPVDLAAGGSQGVEFLPPMTSSTTPTPYTPFTGPTGTYELTLASKGPLSEVIQFPGFDFSVDGTAGTDKLTIDTSTDSVSITPAPGAAPSATATITVDQQTSDGGLQSASVSGSPASAPMSLSFNGTEAEVSGGAHRPAGVAFTLSNQPTGGVPQTFTAPLSVPAGSVAAVTAPNWASYSGGAVTATVGQAGKTGKPVQLANHARPPRSAKVVSLKVSGRTLIAALSLPAMASGSTATLTTTFLSGQGKIEHEVTTTLTKLGHASSRQVKVHVPAGLAPGSSAIADLIANVLGTGARAKS